MTDGSAANLQDAASRRVFEFLEPDEIDELFEYLQNRECPAGTVLIHEGEASSYTGFLVQGRLAVKKRTEFFGKYIIVAIFEAGAIVGEGAMAEQMDRSTIVIVLEDSRLLTLSLEKMNLLCSRNPGLATKLYRRFLLVSHLRLQKAGERLSQLL